MCPTNMNQRKNDGEPGPGPGSMSSFGTGFAPFPNYSLPHDSYLNLQRTVVILSLRRGGLGGQQPPQGKN